MNNLQHLLYFGQVGRYAFNTITQMAFAFTQKFTASLLEGSKPSQRLFLLQFSMIKFEEDENVEEQEVKKKGRR